MTGTRRRHSSRPYFGRADSLTMQPPSSPQLCWRSLEKHLERADDALPVQPTRNGLVTTKGTHSTDFAFGLAYRRYGQRVPQHGRYRGALPARL